MLTRYVISQKEIIRRKKAFLSLSISFFLGLILASILVNVLISYLFFELFAVMLLLANLWIDKFFNSFLKMRTYLSKEFLIRSKRKFLIKKINKIKIKRTTNNAIREIGVFFDDRKSLFIDGLSNFEKFKINLLQKAGKNVVIKNSRELVNFDSISFYPILGLILSFGTVYFFKLMINSSYQTMQIILLVLVIYVLSIGIYLVISKPMSKRY